jgi:tetratricopeptide (TPR) repeat protein
LLLCLAATTGLQAQVGAGDSAWAAGDFAAARVAYERALHDNPGSVRALYRLGVLASWNNQLDSALALLRDAREVEPGDPDVRTHEATVLAWQGRYADALARWDSLVAEFPGRRDLALGRARTLSWSGRLRQADTAYAALVASDPNDLDARTGWAQTAAWSGDYLTAIHRYQEALDRNPDHVPSLVGLAQVRTWQGRTAEARLAVDHALRIAPEDRTALEVRASIRALTRPRLDLTLGWSHDSDRNTLWWQSLGSSIALGPGLRGFASAGIAEASDPAREGTRLSAEAGVTRDAGNLSLSAAFGVRRLAVDDAADRSLGTWRGAVSYRFARTAGAGLSYAHYSFDETALGRDVDIDEVSVDGDVQLHPDLILAYGGGLGWLSDDNRRHSAVVALTQRFARGLTGGIYARILGYRSPGFGYFSPDRFLVSEGSGSYTYGLRQWEARLSGGLGVQQVGEGGRAQSEWHAEARLARRWSVINEVALSGGISNSAESSTTGAYRYYTAALSVRLGL